MDGRDGGDQTRPAESLSKPEPSDMQQKKVYEEKKARGCARQSNRDVSICHGHGHTCPQSRLRRRCTWSYLGHHVLPHLSPL